MPAFGVPLAVHSQSIYTPGCTFSVSVPGGTQRLVRGRTLWTGYSLLFIEGNNQVYNQDLGMCTFALLTDHSGRQAACAFNKL